MNYFVYLIKDESRLIISSTEIINNNYHQLMTCNGEGKGDTLLASCKMFCIGYIMGNGNFVHKIVNNLNEFA